MITGSDVIPYRLESDLDRLFENLNYTKLEKTIEEVEIKKTEAHNFKITEETLPEKLSPSERLNNNLEAISMLNRVESGERELDSSAQEVLAKYVGWGGLSEVFDESREGQWKEARSFLKENLSQSEYEAAKESTLTAFYTPKTVIDSIYSTLSGTGFKSGNILEPSMGIGNFIGNLPDEMNKSKFYGVDTEPLRRQGEHRSDRFHAEDERNALHRPQRHTDHSRGVHVVADGLPSVLPRRALG